MKNIGHYQGLSGNVVEKRQSGNARIWSKFVELREFILKTVTS